MAWEGLNRRKFPRVKYPCLIVLQRSTEGKDTILTHTENIGIGGVCVIIKDNLKMFTLVDVELDLLDLEDHVKCSGKVVWCVRRKSTEASKPLYYDIGVEFTDVSDENRQRIDVIVGRLVNQGYVV